MHETMANTLTFTVKGMTCSSCEVLIERKLRKVAGVERVHVSRAKEEVRIKSATDIPLEKLQEALQDTGYSLSAEKALSANPYSTFESKSPSAFVVKRRHIEIGAAFLIIVGAYLLLRQFDILPKGLGISDNMSYGFIFVIGLVAATSTCLAIAGGLLLAVAAKHNEKYPQLKGWQKFRPHLFFNVGRIASYTLLGGVIGLLGSAISLPPNVTGILTIGASVLMVVVGIQLLGIFPWLNKFSLKMPKIFAHKLYDASTQQHAASSKVSFLFGASTFFLPCGFTQALQLYVLGKGSFFVGALTMLAFSLGTLPSLAGIGAFSSFAKKNIQRHFMTFSAVLVIILGISNIVPGLNIMGATVGLPSTTDPSAIGTNTILDDKQVIHMEVRGLDYFPAAFQLKKGIPVEWNIDGRGAQGCGQIISVPRLGITEQLSRNEITTISFTPQEEGKITFSCGMGMAGPGVFDVQA